MSKSQIITLTLIAYFTHITSSKSIYSIIAPNTIRPNSQFHVAVSLHESPNDGRIKVGIISTTYTDFKIVDVRPFTSELVHFDIPNLQSDRYSLTAEGVSGVLFTNETQLHFENKEFTVLLQTDKAIYRPGDLVHYHLLILNRNLKPVRPNVPIIVEIRDSSNAIIKRDENAFLIQGVSTGSLQLADYPNFGQWSILVEVKEETHLFTFEVLDYIPPKFIVDIETSKHVFYKDNKIQANVKAYYPFGRKVKGEATVSIYPTFYGSLQPFVNDLITRKVQPIDGSAFFEFDIEKELNLQKEYQRDYLLDALIEEQSTNSVQNFSKIITLHLDYYRVETVSIPRYYVPGVPFEVKAKVVKSDNSELGVFDTKITGYLTNMYGSSEVYNKSSYQLNSKGEVVMKFTVPDKDNDDYHSVITDYMGILTELGKIPRKHLHSRNFLLAKVLNENPMVNHEVSIFVTSRTPLKYLIYQIVGRGDIIFSRTVAVPDTRTHIFKFLATFAMVPKAKLLIYTIIDGEFVYDEQIIEFGKALLNNVQLEAPLKAPPGQGVDITITTKPFSYIGLMVIDRDVLNIRAGNQLSYDHITEALQDYDLLDHNTPIGSPGKLSGVITMTNADFFVEKEDETEQTLVQTNAIIEEEDKLKTIKKTDIGPAHKIETNTLAPGKGRYAFSYVPKPFWHDPRIHIMHEPAPTWLFMNISSGSDGRSSIHRRIPSKITSWSISAFSVDAVTGLGLLDPTKSLQAYKDFYITTKLPYSIKLGEIIAIPFVVTNKRSSSIIVDVTFYNTAQDFELLKVEDNTPKIELYRRRSIKVEANSTTSLSFIVQPKRIGLLNVKAVATSNSAGDTVEDNLLVEYPGATRSFNKGIFFDLSSSSQTNQTLKIAIPKNIIRDSAKIEISAVGDISGSILPKIDDLIFRPTSCGEQSFINFMPNIMTLRYLERQGKSSTSISNRLKKNLELGYQRLLYYRKDNGAFSSFASVKEGSTWLTAYAARGLSQAASYTQIDEEVIAAALKYLEGTQKPTGEFDELAVPFEDFMDGGVSVAAFVTMAFLENTARVKEYNRLYSNTINKALDFIARSLDNSDENVHAMAIGTYVLSLAQHRAKGAFLQRLDSKAITNDTQKWWQGPIPAAEKSSPWYNETRSVNIEITSYAALALLQNNLLANAVPVFRWLLDQRNEMGGFISTQDSVVGLQALYAFAEQFSSKNTNIQVASSYGKGAETIMNVNQDNLMAIQTYELPSNTNEVDIKATGTGYAYVQLTYKYNTNITSAWPRFVLDPTVNRNAHSDYLHLSACTSYVPVSDENEKSNMAVMEIHLPSGFVVDKDTLPTLESIDRIKKVETLKGNTVVVIYFDYVTRREICPTLHAYKTVKVTNHRPVPVIMYDYYDNARQARQFFRAPKSNLCDICEDANCSQKCERAEKQKASSLEDSQKQLEMAFGSTASNMNLHFLALLCSILLRLFN